MHVGSFIQVHDRALPCAPLALLQADPPPLAHTSLRTHASEHACTHVHKQLHTCMHACMPSRRWPTQFAHPQQPCRVRAPAQQPPLMSLHTPLHCGCRSQRCSRLPPAAQAAQGMQPPRAPLQAAAAAAGAAAAVACSRQLITDAPAKLLLSFRANLFCSRRAGGGGPSCKVARAQMERFCQRRGRASRERERPASRVAKAGRCSRCWGGAVRRTAQRRTCLGCCGCWLAWATASCLCTCMATRGARPRAGPLPPRVVPRGRARAAGVDFVCACVCITHQHTVVHPSCWWAAAEAQSSTGCRWVAAGLPLQLFLTICQKRCSCLQLFLTPLL